MTKYLVTILITVCFIWEQWRRVQWAGSGLGPTFNPPGEAMSGLVQFLEQCFTGCFEKQTPIILFKLHEI